MIPQVRRVRFGSRSSTVLAVVAAALVSGTASAQIATGNNSGVDGYLMIAPDEYGAWASTTFSGNGDLYNPAGGLNPMEAAFTSGFFIFTANGRELLTDNGAWQSVIGGGDGTLDRTILSANNYSDTTGNGVNDTVESSFAVTGSGVNLEFGLTQQVRAKGASVSFLRQTYTVTNVGSSSLAFSMVRTFDGDLLWDGDFSNDEVGTSMHGAGLGTYVFEQEAAAPGTTAVTLSSIAGVHYYGGKNGVDPGGAGLPYGFGTDTQVWDNFGTPANWENHIAGVGYNMNGVSGPAPPGSTSPEDGFIGMGFDFELGAGQSLEFTVFHTYGANVPVPAPGAIALLGVAGVMARRRRR